MDQRQLFADQLIAAQTKSQNLDNQIALLLVKQQKLQEDIDDITSGKKAIRFIVSRVSDEKYINSLGIISWIRKDFEQLDFLLGQQKIASVSKKEDGTATPVVFSLERIILYIDDLDRCPESTVVKVLEAINLLLAFPLFVVVVGVDPRWMHNALQVKYPHLKNGLQSKTVVSDLPQEADFGFSTTSSDYLEKIFQIPFALKPMTERSKEKSIDDQLQNPSLPLSTIKLNNSVPANLNPPAQSGADHDTDDAMERSTNVTEPLVPPTPDDVVNEPMPEIIEIDIARLEISDQEKAFMKAMPFMMGNSPRTIKRYINIYRIIRTHEGFVFEARQENSYYFAALLILAIMTDRPHIMDNFRQEILNAASYRPFIHVISESPLLNDESLPSLCNLITMIERSNNTDTINEITGLRIKEFKANFELVTRFSFFHSPIQQY